MKPFLQTHVLRNLFTTLVGQPGETTLESRIFNSICLVVILAMLYNIPFNYSIGLTETALITFILLLLFSFLYYLSRIQNKFYISITIAGVSISILLALNYFFNAGVIGSSLLLFMLIYFLLTIIAPGRQYGFWFYFNLLIVFGLLAAEYFYPELVVRKYNNRLNQLIDVASTYLVGVVLIYLAMQFFRKAYKAEQRLVEQKSLVLEQLNAEKNKLFSIVSHDLRSPLASVQQYLEVMRETELSEEQKKQIEGELLTVVNHTQEMLFNLLSWSTTQMSGTQVNLVQVNVYRVLKPVLEIYKPLAVKKGIRLEHSIDPDLNVSADSNMLPLIVRNLLGNAIKFTPSGGSISIYTTSAGTDCLIAVKDTGIGIESAYKETVFSLKSRSTFGTNHEKGVGLGLYLCKEYAELQKGKLWFESKQGAGTTFYLSLALTR